MDITSKSTNAVLTGKKSLTEHGLKRTNINNLWLAMVRLRKNGNNLRNDKYDTVYNKPNYKSLQRFCDTKSNWQTSQYKENTPYRNIWNLFLNTNTTSSSNTRRRSSHDSDENYTHYGNHKPRKKAYVSQTFHRHNTYNRLY